MSRSAADATRFTATGPYATSKPSTAPYKLPGFLANSKPNTNSHSQNNGSGGNRQETPKEKVERLRAQARAARLEQSTSRMDQVVDIGRRFANKAHKGMVYTLITASGICGVLTVYSMVSLTLYNRRQRALWIEKQLQTLQDAKTAYVKGTANDEQLELLKKEKIDEIVKQKREEEKSQRPWNKAKAFLLGGLKNEDIPASEAATANVENNKLGVLDSLNTAGPEPIKASPSIPSPVPGQLDILAKNAETTTNQTTRSWKSWLTGR